jgi:glycine cleavage system transcriptional repressor
LSRKNFFLLTAFGKDRPGIVAGVSRILFELGANIEDASMTRLGGEFAMMLITDLPSGTSAARLEKGLNTIEKKLGLQTAVKAIPADAAMRGKSESPKYLISVYGTDHPGIVHRVTDVLAQHKASITDLQTKVTSGVKPVYVMLLEVQAPSAENMDALRSELDDLRQELQVEISLRDIEAVSL